jgi:hypothetical protein
VSALRPVVWRNAPREAVAARLGAMLLARVERLEELDRIVPTSVDWEFTLGGVTYSVAVKVAQRGQR